MKQHAPSTARNRDAILTVLRDVLPARATVLEVASGSGEHAIWFARHLPEVIWQPSDVNPEARTSIDAYRAEENLANLLAAVALDVTALDWEKGRHADALVCINMIHISPWEATEGLFR